MTKGLFIPAGTEPLHKSPLQIDPKRPCLCSMLYSALLFIQQKVNSVFLAFALFTMGRELADVLNGTPMPRFSITIPVAYITCLAILLGQAFILNDFIHPFKQFPKEVRLGDIYRILSWTHVLCLSITTAIRRYQPSMRWWVAHAIALLIMMGLPWILLSLFYSITCIPKPWGSLISGYCPVTRYV
ncbi:hypothetical protein BDV97DRAFT_343303 [Delphinella strobiligena]|nr:hypothetical protein BDV97DRAFT_343303 [Delphinella strobiligena]